MLTWGRLMGWSTKRRRFYPALIDQPEKFWAKVDRRGPDECWPWLGCLSTMGYGRAGKKGYAHRLAWRLMRGPIPAGHYVLHRCDNPPCCNPSHLFLGDAAANARDMAAKGRVGGGPRPRFDWDEARRLAALGFGFREIGRHLGVSHSSVAAAVRRGCRS